MNHCLGPRLDTGLRSCQTYRNSFAKALNVEMTFKLYPTEGWLELGIRFQPGGLPTKVKISTFSIGFKQDAESHNIENAQDRV